MEKGKEPGWWWVVVGIGSTAAFPATVVAVTEDSGCPEKKMRRLRRLHCAVR